MESFNVTVVREDEYKIEVDPKYWYEKTREEFASVFWPLPELESVAKSLARSITALGIGCYYEGFGYVQTFRSSGDEYRQTKSVNGKIVKCEQGDYIKGIVVHVVSHDDEYEIQIEKL